MAIIKNIANGYYSTEAVENVINYILNSDFLDSYGGYGVMLTDNNSIINNFLLTQKGFCKENGARIHHICISFDRNSLLSGDIYDIAQEFSQYIGQDFQNIFGVHRESNSNSDNQHIHFAINSVSYTDGHKFNHNIPYYMPLLKQFGEDYEINFRFTSN